MHDRSIQSSQAPRSRYVDVEPQAHVDAETEGVDVPDPADEGALAPSRAGSNETRRLQLVDNPSARELLVEASRTLAELGMDRGRASGASHRITLGSEGEARAVFARAADKLLDVSNWEAGLGPSSADFTLYDAAGREVVGRGAEEGDFVKIELPGGAPASWVRVEDASLSAERVSIRVRPSYDPTLSPQRRRETEHFFDSAATNTFTLERRDARVRLSVEGRNETPNVGAETRGVVAPLLNRASTIGAWTLGLQHAQWDSFTRELLEGSR